MTKMVSVEWLASKGPESVYKKVSMFSTFMSYLSHTYTYTLYRTTILYQYYIMQVLESFKF
jgi:hypothetical protein